MQPNIKKWKLSADSDYEKILIKNPEKIIENYDELRPFENRCQIICPELKEWYKKCLWSPGCNHGSVDQWWEGMENYIARQDRKSNG